MNKYALILPLAALSALLGYFASSPQMEHVLVIALSSLILLVLLGYLLFAKHQTGEEK